MNTNKIKLGDYTVALDALRGAEWTHSEEIVPSTWEVTEAGSIIATHTNDDVQWRAAEANISAINEDGEPCEIAVEFVVEEGETVRLHVNGGSSNGVYALDEDGEEGKEFYAHELADMIGVYIDDDFAPDAEEAADEFLSAHAGYRYILDEERGFANEWILYACATDAEAEKAMSENGKARREVPSEKARAWIAEAILPRREYEREYGAKKYCGMCYVS
jgi:hypothetical protein